MQSGVYHLAVFINERKRKKIIIIETVKALKPHNSIPYVHYFAFPIRALSIPVGPQHRA